MKIKNPFARKPKEAPGELQVDLVTAPLDDLKAEFRRLTDLIYQAKESRRPLADAIEARTRPGRK